MSIALSMVGSLKKTKKVHQKPGNNPGEGPFMSPPTIPNESDSDDWWEANNKPQAATEHTPVNNLGELIQRINAELQARQIAEQQAQQAAAATPATQPQHEQYFIEEPEKEGARVTDSSIDSDNAYAMPSGELPDSSNEWRKAIIAHEILKRKF
ncbi:MAG: hypothetical protein ACI308_00780 [Muribaculaceae bacterium]